VKNMQPPTGFHYMPNGTLMRNSNHHLGSIGTGRTMMAPVVVITVIFGLFALAGVADQFSSGTSSS